MGKQHGAGRCKMPGRRTSTRHVGILWQRHGNNVLQTPCTHESFQLAAKTDSRGAPKNTTREDCLTKRERPQKFVQEKEPGECSPNEARRQIDSNAPIFVAMNLPASSRRAGAGAQREAASSACSMALFIATLLCEGPQFLLMPPNYWYACSALRASDMPPVHRG